MSSEDARPVPATLEAVAAAAGVSRSTVSRVVNGSTRVSPEVLAAVTQAIEQLRYTPNRAARSLASRQTKVIALVVPEESGKFFGDPYFASIVEGISRGLERSDYVLTLQLTSPSSPSEKVTRYLLGGNVDGALVVSHHSGDHFLAGIGHTLPVVFGGRPLRQEEQGSYFVDVDNVTGAAMGARYLVDLGRERIAGIGGARDMPAGIDRAEGFARTMAAADLSPDLTAWGDFTMLGGARAMRELLDRQPNLDAVFVASDLMAAGAVSVLRQRGRKIPEDVAVVGFDDSPAATGGEIALTTVRQPSAEMGERMAELLLALLRGEQPERANIMQTRMVVRESA